MKEDKTSTIANHADKITLDDLKKLKSAKRNIQNIRMMMKGVNQVGKRIESGINALPEKQQKWLSHNISNILFKILKSNIKTIENNKHFKTTSKTTYKTIVGLSGIGSGFFGSFNLIGSSVFISELYFSTRIMMRSILEIAYSEGEDIYDIDTQLACIQVFALGGNSTAENKESSPYYATREAMETALNKANEYIEVNGVEGLDKKTLGNTNPVLMLIGLITTRLTIQITEKFISRAVPIIGAASGGALNYFYIDHYQKIAKSHFVIRKLEKVYGKDEVREMFSTIE
jgi:hypothetical protein